MQRPLAPLKARALQLLAQREQSGMELRRKLTRHAAAAVKADRESRRDDALGVLSTAPAGSLRVDDDHRDAASVADRVDDVLDWLRTNGFSSDERFTESRVNARWSRFGNLRIRDELSCHGVAPDGELAQRLDDSELQRALQVWERKFGAAPEDAAARARQYRFLAGRGFSPEVIGQTIRRADRDAAVRAK